jgi:CDP-diacylglycerol--glycerol-3-phosphate 3-phosphatidyltransferase/cardiolipin synthase
VSTARRSTPLLPSIVSFTRVPLAIAFVLIDAPLPRVIIIAIAAATDFLDGRLARSLHQGTRFGELADPIADKIFALTVVLTFAFDGSLSLAQLAILLARDIATTIAFLIVLALRTAVRFRARMSGKVTTVLQIGTVLALALNSALVPVLLSLTGIASAWAIADYARYGAVSLRQAARQRERGPLWNHESSPK